MRPTASRIAVAGCRRTNPSAAKPLAPAPRPSTARPPASSSSVAIATAVSAGWREYGSDTNGPIRARAVARATSPSVR